MAEAVKFEFRPKGWIYGQARKDGFADMRFVFEGHWNEGCVSIVVAWRPQEQNPKDFAQRAVNLA